MAVKRLSLTGQGQVRYRLKTPYRDGTTHIVLEPVDFVARLAAVVPPLRVHLMRYLGVFAQHAALRAAITPAGRGPGARSRTRTADHPTSTHVAMQWAARLKRVFGIEKLEQCVRCGGRCCVGRVRDRQSGAGGARISVAMATREPGTGGFGPADSRFAGRAKLGVDRTALLFVLRAALRSASTK